MPCCLPENESCFNHKLASREHAITSFYLNVQLFCAFPAGYDNREAPIRVTCPGDLRTLNAEVKTFDGSTNPHIGLAAIISAGMLGEQGGLGLRIWGW